MNWHNWLVAACLLLTVCDLRCLAGEMCPAEPREKIHRRRTTQSDPFSYRPVPVPVKVRCDPEAGSVKNQEPCNEDIRLIASVREKQKSKVDGWRMTAETSLPQSEKVVKEVPALSKVSAASDMMTAECEQCEIQIKANGDGVFLRCRKCHPSNADGMRFPTPGTNKVMQLP
ncbi:UNVERIFIED_CONTAM: hypothetical protein PYX00_004866 [Menopon gallinae]|uniref:Uncharacterized protein n=1 Tax=Menopon gallinae TaxID=328185 RepID=A0AAW2I681_9NEOP